MRRSKASSGMSSARPAGYRALPIPGASSSVAALSVAGDATGGPFTFTWAVSRDGVSDLPLTVTPSGISFRMPTEVSGVGRLEVRVELAAPQLTCNGFSMCSVTIKGSQTFDATLQ